MRKMPTLAGATNWINSSPVSQADLSGHVVLINFWTLTCINWLRTVPFVRAWSRRYQDDGLLVVGVHTPEFAFEHDASLVEQAVSDRDIGYPIAVDNDYGVWNAFDNHYWPAVYLLDAEGHRRGQHFGEGAYEQVERAIQQLLGVEGPLTSAHGIGVEADADWPHLHSPETYLGYARAANLASGSGSPHQGRQHFHVPDVLALNHWGLSGEWTISLEHAVLHQPGGSVAYRFQARDAHVVLSTLDGQPTPFQVLLDGAAPGANHGVDCDPDGFGVLREGRMYQLVRETEAVRDRLVDVTFSGPGVRAYVFTFG